ncbi:hypothetical protein MNBD_GAMMA25-2364 [hydrothermal vent metagenome]|uniref:CYTH domain-containing protein n=1 Tax=hydrothermal vent metagenome TaxID=652676 RepID=A0A3B1BFU5_9ZZZZ
MGVEIEKKFLLRNDNWRKQSGAGTAFKQGYLIGSEKASVRIRIQGIEANINIKSATLGITRQEYEYSIPLEEAEELLTNLCEKPLIEKTRYHLVEDKHVWEVDVFDGDNAGLVVAEIELQSENEDFFKPDWLGDEVSDDPRYYNSCLVKHPYCNW